jgi:ArsR family transcriptional regulator
MYQKVFRQHAELLKALANPKRLEVVQLLKQGSLTVSDMERMLGLAQANLSQHLMVLRRLGVVRAERRGKEKYYHLAHQNFAKASDLLRGVLMERLGGRATAAVKALKVVTDPMCGMHLTPASAAATLNRSGATYYFCGSGCARGFRNT